ncbi:hypothetical protein IIB79_08710 [candidate division KSB1 bacterium]|nr:hypothetical protein [candidate division KSB1 bacterium]
MKIKTLFLICLSLWIGCNNDRSPDTANEIITEALSLELTFGADEQNTLDDFLIVGGWEIVVDDSNNVYVLDENRLKVFYPDGSEKVILGGPGQGPGEFLRPGGLTISPSGFITVTNNGGMSFGSVNYYKGTQYLNQEKINNRLIASEYPNKWDKYYVQIMNTMMLGNEEKISFVLSTDSQIINNTVTRSTFRYRALVYETKDSYTELEEFKDTYQILEENGSATIPYRGRFYWHVLPGRKIVHAFPGNARVENSKESLYEFTVISIDNLEKTPIQHTYSPVLLPDSLIDKYMIDRDNQNLYSKVRDILREYPYYPPIRSITTDAEFIFVSTYHNFFYQMYLQNYILV